MVLARTAPRKSSKVALLLERLKLTDTLSFIRLVSASTSFRRTTYFRRPLYFTMLSCWKLMLLTRKQFCSVPPDTDRW